MPSAGFVILPVQFIHDVPVVDGCATRAARQALLLLRPRRDWRLTPHVRHLVTGIDRHPWAVEEARWTYRQLGLAGRARRGDVAQLPPLAPGTAAVAAYVLNELPDTVRDQVKDRLIEAAGRGTRILVIEPIARSISPWWNLTASRIAAAGGRSDEWRFTVDLPPLVRLLDKAAGLDHREITVRSLYFGGSPGRD